MSKQLRDIIELRYGKALPERSRRLGSVPVYGSGGVVGFHNQTLVNGPGIIVGRKGSIGSVFWSNSSFFPIDTTYHVVLRSKKTNFRFIYYLLKCLPLSELNSDAAVPGLNREIVYSIKVNMPQLDEQHRIVKIISPYDELIKINRRRIFLLENAMRLLYREWFVNFRFPGYEHTKIANGLPDGWKHVKLGTVLFELEYGQRPRGGASEVEGIPSIGAENVVSLGHYNYTKEKYVPEVFFQKMRRGVIHNRDVVLYKDGAHIGRTSMFGDNFPHSQCAVNEHVFILRCSAGVGQNYLYFWLSQPETKQSVVNLNANTAQPGISQEKLKTLLFTLAPEPLRQKFNEIAETSVSKIFRLALMNRKLAQARDLILPRLMNGGFMPKDG